MTDVEVKCNNLKLPLSLVPFLEHILRTEDLVLLSDGRLELERNAEAYEGAKHKFTGKFEINSISINSLMSVKEARQLCCKPLYLV